MGQRLEKIKARQGVLTDIHEEVKTKLVKDLKNDAQNKTFVTKLITQGLLMFLENEVSIRCRQSDVSLVQSCLKDAREYAKVIKKETGVDKSVNISVDQTQFLPATSLGGVILSCGDGKITIDNTIDLRLKLVMEQDKPAIRKQLFSDSRS